MVRSVKSSHLHIQTMPYVYKIIIYFDKNYIILGTLKHKITEFKRLFLIKYHH